MMRGAALALGVLAAACGGGHAGPDAPAAQLAGTVFDARSSTRPLAGATVELVGASPANQTTTAADGSYTLAVPAGQAVLVRASATGYAAAQEGLVVDAGGARLDLAPILSGVLTQAQGQLGTTFDPAKGFVRLKIKGASAGTGAMLDAAHDLPFICDPGMPCVHASTASAAGELMFPNVAVGDTSITAVPAMGVTCTSAQPIDRWEIDPGVITGVTFDCQ